MANLTPISSNSNVPQLEITTVALAGPGQAMNSQAQALLNRLTFETTRAGTAEAALQTNINATNIYAFNIQVGTVYTFVIGDAKGGTEKAVVCTSATAVTVTIPVNSSVNFPLGTVIELIQDGAGKVTVAAAGGVTINSLAGNKSIAGQYSRMTIVQKAVNTWWLFGTLIA